MSQKNWLRELGSFRPKGMQDTKLAAGIDHPIWQKLKPLGGSALEACLTQDASGVQSIELPETPSAITNAILEQGHSGPATSYL